VTVAAAFVTRLLSLTAVTDLVGTRIRNMRLRQGEAQERAIRVQRISETQEMHLRGAVNGFRSRVQVDSYAPEASGVDPYLAAAAIDAAVHGDGAGSGLCGFAGAVGGDGFVFTSILPDGVREEYDPEEQRVVRISRDYIANWTSS
jgi:hypothetical protein